MGRIEFPPTEINVLIDNSPTTIEAFPEQKFLLIEDFLIPEPSRLMQLFEIIIDPQNNDVNFLSMELLTDETGVYTAFVAPESTPIDSPHYSLIIYYNSDLNLSKSSERLLYHVSLPFESVNQLINTFPY